MLNVFPRSLKEMQVTTLIPEISRYLNKRLNGHLFLMHIAPDKPSN